jgi:hypothetical protein
MHKRQTTLVTEDLNPNERVNKPYRVGVLQLGKLSGMPELDTAAVDRDRPRESYRARSQVGQAMQDRLLHTVQSDGRQRRLRCARRLDLAASEGRCKFDDEERIAARRRVNGRGEGRIWRGAQITTQYGRHRIRAERRRAQDIRRSHSCEVTEEGVVAAWFARTTCGDQDDRQTRDPPAQVEQEAKGRTVAPVSVVDHKSEWLGCGEIGGEAEQCVQNLERPTGGRLLDSLDGASRQHRSRRGGVAREQGRRIRPSENG